MKPETNIWKIISLALFLLIVVLGYLLFSKSKNIEITQTSVVSENILESEMNDNSVYSIPDGENIFNIGSILRIDDALVDDQFYAQLWPQGTDETYAIEISNSVDIKIFSNLDVFKEKIEVTIEELRRLTRQQAKSNTSSKFFYKIQTRNNLIEKIEQINP